MPTQDTKYLSIATMRAVLPFCKAIGAFGVRHRKRNSDTTSSRADQTPTEASQVRSAAPSLSLSPGSISPPYGHRPCQALCSSQPFPQALSALCAPFRKRGQSMSPRRRAAAAPPPCLLLHSQQHCAVAPEIAPQRVLGRCSHLYPYKLTASGTLGHTPANTTIQGASVAARCAVSCFAHATCATDMTHAQPQARQQCTAPPPPPQTWPHTASARAPFPPATPRLPLICRRRRVQQPLYCADRA